MKGNKEEVHTVKGKNQNCEKYENQSQLIIIHINRNINTIEFEQISNEVRIYSQYKEVDKEVYESDIKGNEKETKMLKNNKAHNRYEKRMKWRIEIN